MVSAIVVQSRRKVNMAVRGDGKFGLKKNPTPIICSKLHVLKKSSIYMTIRLGMEARGTLHNNSLKFKNKNMSRKSKNNRV